MTDRKRLVFTLWLTLTLPLLAWGQVVPIRATGFGAASSRSAGPRLDLAPSSGRPLARLRKAIVVESVVEVSAFASENEEQDWTDSLGEPRVSFLTPRSFRKVSDFQLIPPLPILSRYPLRC